MIEGYITPEEYAETEETERVKMYDVAPLFPEWRGTFGKTRKARKFQVTAFTHRKDRPIYPGFCADSFEGEYVGMDFREAMFLELCERLNPGLVVDVNILDCLKIWGGLVLQAKSGVKRRRVSSKSAGDGTLESGNAVSNSCRRRCGYL